MRVIDEEAERSRWPRAAATPTIDNGAAGVCARRLCRSSNEMDQHRFSPLSSPAGADPAPRGPRDYYHGLLGGLEIWIPVKVQDQ